MLVSDLADLFEDNSRDAVYVGHIARSLTTCLGAITTEVLFSHESAQKQRQHHPDLTLEHYQLMPAILALGTVIHKPPQSLTFLYHDAVHYQHWFRLAIKSTRNGAHLLVVSFHKVWEDEYERLIRKAGRQLLRA